MRAEVLAGLTTNPKTLPCKYFYDERGSELFDAICELPEYYLTRTELAIMQSHAAEMATVLGSRGLLVEPGSGTSTKTRLLLDKLHWPCAYVPVDISREHLIKAADQLNRHYPDLEVLPVCADFSQAFALPAPHHPAARSVIYFPGSTIGNFEPDATVALLKQLLRLAGRKGALLIGVDLNKDRTLLEAAYNDAAGVTAAFNLNLLARLNRELHSDFNLKRFQHRALYNPAEGRIEMRLVSLDEQTVHIADESVHFRAGEAIVTEYSYKHTLPGFAALAAQAGWNVQKVWTDDRRWFSVQYLTAG
ncbi:MAG: L-histidine N(alpha)-methyltransferase [Gammaproteobacteria bacterium]|nr:L-histidine N(alpha)-methyltransferase [Gammaproteobacteria bacterium]MBU6509203.1 L-histidine N(alpha)-methyltransferase [Gammaproteobacteria bacterium]MDE1983390.1 L-histidine N(alpha)-methyltransferase [Gammaproteobacteria bacterium]MDE2107794.1 L-histidine N(alpha)-methyltransferase [Gammaproteobacteria bacterium]MDE2461369.1 L-histidine N(alpha)-methyltransferase [Gammaproteobacteria bacterium]